MQRKYFRFQKKERLEFRVTGWERLKTKKKQNKKQKTKQKQKQKQKKTKKPNKQTNLGDSVLKKIKKIVF